MHFLALFYDPLALKKAHSRDAPYSKLVDIDILCNRKEQGLY